MSPTSRTLKVIRDDGWMAGIVERFITAGKNRAFGNRSDLFGIFDIIAVQNNLPFPYPGTLGIQVFSTAWREHEEKMVENGDAVRTWIKAGNGIELWGWRKLKLKRGGKAFRWTPKIKRVLLAEDDSISFQDLTWT